ncbi:MAG: hypothetical protein HC894_08635 [Microcoleus sp. SM1_3_4]|nr:hypothetical protein [Microcoleus sp. SM1_3_4]
MEISIEDRETLERLEEELWCEETRYDKQRMNELLAGDFFEFGRSGRIYQKQDTLAHSRKTINAVFPLPEFHARLLDENTAQVTYNSVANYDGVVESRAEALFGREQTAVGFFAFIRVRRFNQESILMFQNTAIALQ